ncbi:MAG: peroxiredoxin [Nitrososphaerales archaeon]
MSELSIGQRAPEFELRSTTGSTARLADYLGKKVVLYFYPKDDTPGCTIEACGFRDDYNKIKEKGGEIIGISVDDIDSHNAFKSKYNLPFPLVSDTTTEVAQKYGVLGTDKATRVTFIIDKEGKIAEIFPKVEPDKHAAEVLSVLDRI